MSDNDQDYLFQEDLQKEESKKTNLLRITIIILLISFLVGVIFYIYNFYQDKNDGEMLIIAADNDEIKVAPSDPGGMIVSNMDKDIYDSLDENNKDDNKIERILPPAEEPLEKNLLKSESSEEPEQELENLKESNSATPEITASAENLEKSKSEEYIAPIARLDNKTKTEKITAKNTKIFKVQLAAFKSKTDAEKHWKSILKRYPKIFSEYQHYIVDKNIPNKGIFQRLQVGPFENESDARDACKKFQEVGINCFIIKP